MPKGIIICTSSNVYQVAEGENRTRSELIREAH